jgi:TatD DNase family protein
MLSTAAPPLLSIRRPHTLRAIPQHNNNPTMLKGFSAKGQPILGPIFELSHSRLRLCDIGVNIMDEMFTHGEYNNKRLHDSDMDLIFDRAHSMGVSTMIMTGSCIKNSLQTLSFINKRSPNTGLYFTAGIHPCSSKIFEQKSSADVIAELKKVVDDGLQSGHLVAFGECGLDYDRLFYCEKATQLHSFEQQLELATNYDLPLFLHNRNTEGDFLTLVAKYRDRLRGGGVVHSFTGSLEEMKSYTDLGYYISFNGCSLRTDEGLANAAAVPEHLLLLETDAPWCGVKATHPGFSMVSTTIPSKKKEKFEAGFMVKDRNEPCTLVQVLEIIAKVRGVDPFELSEKIHANTEACFPLLKKQREEAQE